MTFNRAYLLTSLRLAVLGVVAFSVSGCATITGEPTQAVTITVVDANDRSVEGMRCRVSNGAAEYLGNSPMHALQVRRSFSDLEIECRYGAMVARGTAVSRGQNLLVSALPAVLPGGTAMVALDHISGYRYAYPSLVTLRLGEHLVFDASDQVTGRPTRGMQADSSNR